MLMSPGKTISLVSVLFAIAIMGGLLVSAVVFALRRFALMLLGVLVMAAQSADPQVLAEATRQADAATQVRLIRNLSELGPDAEPYLGMLKERFEVGEPEVQAAALEALKKIDPERWEHLP
jgi:hypothetical protein